METGDVFPDDGASKIVMVYAVAKAGAPDVSVTSRKRAGSRRVEMMECSAGQPALDRGWTVLDSLPSLTKVNGLHPHFDRREGSR